MLRLTRHIPRDIPRHIHRLRHVSVNSAVTRAVTGAVAGVALALMLGGCGAEESNAPEEAPEEATEEATADPAIEQIEPQAPEELVELKTVELETVELGEEGSPEDDLATPEKETIDTEALLAAIRARDEAALMDIEPVKGPLTITVMRGLDKVTARVMLLEAPEGEEIQFGTLAITAKTCRSRPPEETPETFAFLEIDDVKNNDERERVFTGWMLASSPALNPLEHAVYDVWVIDCRIADGGASGSSE